jgi:formylmethanofuran dehydrogenase subunit E
MTIDLQTLLEQSSARHNHLCPRQVLGVRMGLAGVAALALTMPRQDKRLLVILETDGCFVSGVEAATGAAVCHRTLRVEDYGKVAATFVDTKTGVAVRITPHLNIRRRARFYAPDEGRHYFAQLMGYQVMPDEELLTVQEVRLTTPIEDLISRPGRRVNCAICGEEIINEREVWRQDVPVCQGCAGPAYYALAKLFLSCEAQTKVATDRSKPCLLSRTK